MNVIVVLGFWYPLTTWTASKAGERLGEFELFYIIQENYDLLKFFFFFFFSNINRAVDVRINTAFKSALIQVFQVSKQCIKHVDLWWLNNTTSNISTDSFSLIFHWLSASQLRALTFFLAIRSIPHYHSFFFGLNQLLMMLAVITVEWKHVRGNSQNLQ